MRYLTISPPEDLKRYVRCFWVLEGEATEQEPYIYRGYADGCCELVFHYREPFDMLHDNGKTESSFSAGIHAQTNTFMRCIVYRNFAMFGCYVYPFALPLLFGYPSSDLSNEMVDLSAVIGVSGSDLADEMLNAIDNETRVDIMINFLRARLYDKQEFSHLEKAYMQLYLSGDQDIDQLARESFMSRRNFERRFRDIAGFSPHHYSRIVKFQRALKYYDSGLKLTEIAHNCGYYDQSHFINDFRKFSGYTPKAYFSGKAEGSEYLDS